MILEMHIFLPLSGKVSILNVANIEQLSNILIKKYQFKNIVHN